MKRRAMGQHFEPSGVPESEHLAVRRGCLTGATTQETLTLVHIGLRLGSHTGICEVWTPIVDHTVHDPDPVVFFAEGSYPNFSPPTHNPTMQCSTGFLQHGGIVDDQ